MRSLLRAFFGLGNRVRESRVAANRKERIQLQSIRSEQKIEVS
jgi:hypothetical protein